MSELIENHEYRLRTLKELIRELHDGKSVDEVKERFGRLIAGVSPGEIAEMEQSLIADGLPVTEVQRLCDVHAAVFKGALTEAPRAGEAPGYPLDVFKQENRAITRLIDDRLLPHLDEFGRQGTGQSLDRLRDDLTLLGEVDKHYGRKENLLFPYLEKHGVTAPPKVMWGVDDEIRAAIKRAQGLLDGFEAGKRDELVAGVTDLTGRVKEMIFKEESILFPMAAEILSEEEWARIGEESDAIGYCLIAPETGRRATSATSPAPNGQGGAAGDAVELESGTLTARHLRAVLDTLPVDVTFIDQDDVVRYFSQGKDRIFPRTKAVIGRRVQNCHPPASVHVVEKLLADLKSGAKDHEDFWLQVGGRFVYIRYFAVRDGDGAYLGTLEVTQDIGPIQRLAGEKRLLG